MRFTLDSLFKTGRNVSFKLISVYYNGVKVKKHATAIVKSSKDYSYQ
jgi:hypothetical protein